MLRNSPDQEMAAVVRDLAARVAQLEREIRALKKPKAKAKRKIATPEDGP